MDHHKGAFIVIIVISQLNDVLILAEESLIVALILLSDLVNFTYIFVNFAVPKRLDVLKVVPDEDIHAIYVLLSHKNDLVFFEIRHVPKFQVIRCYEIVNRDEVFSRLGIVVIFVFDVAFRQFVDTDFLDPVIKHKGVGPAVTSKVVSGHEVAVCNKNVLLQW